MIAMRNTMEVLLMNKEQRNTPSSFRLTLALKLQRRRTGCKARNKNKNVEGYRKLNFTWYMKNVESTIDNRSESELGEANQKGRDKVRQFSFFGINM